MLSLEGQANLVLESLKALVGLPPDSLWGLLALANFMRLSLKKAAHAAVSGAAYRKSGTPPLVPGPGFPARGTTKGRLCGFH